MIENKETKGRIGRKEGVAQEAVVSRTSGQPGIRVPAGNEKESLEERAEQAPTEGAAERMGPRVLFRKTAAEQNVARDRRAAHIVARPFSKTFLLFVFVGGVSFTTLSVF